MRNKHCRRCPFRKQDICPCEIKESIYKYYKQKKDKEKKCQ